MEHHCSPFFVVSFASLILKYHELRKFHKAELEEYYASLKAEEPPLFDEY